jgi:hypothetical protein
MRPFDINRRASVMPSDKSDDNRGKDEKVSRRALIGKVGTGAVAAAAAIVTATNSGALAEKIEQEPKNLPPEKLTVRDLDLHRIEAKNTRQRSGWRSGWRSANHDAAYRPIRRR